MKRRYFFPILITMFGFVNLAVCEKSTITPHSLVRFTEENQQMLLNGEVVYVYREVRNKDGSKNGYGESSAIIESPRDKCLDIFSRFDTHYQFLPRNKESRILKSWDDKTLVYKKFKVFFKTIEYTTLYTVHPDTYQVDFKLSKDYPHDIKDNSGYFKFDAIDNQKTLVSFVLTNVETGIKVPKFIQNYMTSKDLPEVVNCIRKRIESGGAWCKKD